MKQLSFAIVIAALAVSAPRLTLAFLIGDAVEIPEQTEVLILTVTGIASGMVLTVGNAVLAHALASKAHQRSALWWLCALSWVMFLLGAVVLVAPTLTMGIRRSQMAEVMGSSTAEWIWAVVAVVIVELLVGAAMAAMILVDEDRPEAPQQLRPSRWGRLLDAAVDRVASELAESPSTAGSAAIAPTTETGLDAANDARQQQVNERQAAIVALCQNQGAMSAPELITRLQDEAGITVSTQTIRHDCNALVEAGLLIRQGRKWNVTAPA